MTGLVFHLIAHTHWDREWYLPHAVFQARLVAMVDDLIERLESDPGYRSFLLDGQTVLVEDYLRVRPEREQAIRALVRAGRLQLGPWYVLADELIPSGEALVRNLLAGAADAERWGGRSDVLYSPDAFGHPAAWPSLAREFGMKYGVLWRGLDGASGAARDLYRWRGPDGKEVLLWHFSRAGYEIGAALPADAARLAERWPPVRDALVERAATQHVPVFIGADHHAAHPDVPRLRDLLAELEPAHGFRVSRLDEFFQAVDAAGTAAVPLAGELRWSYRSAWTLQGVHGTRAPLKRRNSEVELWLERFAEPLAALARRAGGRDRRPLLGFAWRTLLRCQFHDAIAGCVSDAVADAVAQRLARADALAREIVRDGLHDLVRHDPDAAREHAGPRTPALVLWNPAARARSGVTIADLTFFLRDVLVGPPGGGRAREGEGDRPFALATAEGGVIPVQVLSRAKAVERLDAPRHYPDQDEVVRVRVAFRAPPTPGLGALTLTLRERAAGGSEPGATARGRSLANERVEVAIDQSGALSLHDRETGERFQQLLRLEDEADAGDTYTYAPAARRGRVRANGPVRVRCLAAGPLVAALEARWEMRPRSGRIAARLVVMLHADSPLVRCVLDVDNAAVDHRLRARLPTALAGIPAVAGSAFGAVTRPAVMFTAGDYPLETPVRTAPAQRFVAVAEGRRGLTLLAPGFFEYEWTERGDLVFTLLRAVGQLSRADLPTRPGHAAWPAPTPGAQCLGRTRIELALAPVSQAAVERGDVVPALWEDGFVPLRGFWLRDAVALAPHPGGIALEGAGLVLSAVKPAQNGSPMVLRCYNATGARVGGAWRFEEGIKSAHRVRADERSSAPLVLEGRGRTLRFVALPHEIVTILVT